MFGTVVLISLALLLLYVYLAWNRNYWKNRGVPGPQPSIILGSFPGAFMQKINQVVEIDELYRKYKNKTPFVGVHTGRDPQLLIIDSDMIKEVLIKDFKNFEDNHFATLIDKETDPLFGRNPFTLSGSEWREKRAEITPAFTVSRIKALYPIIDDVCNRLTDFIRTGPGDANGFEAKEICTKFVQELVSERKLLMPCDFPIFFLFPLSAKYTTEVVSNCIYGIDSNSLTKEKSVMFTMGTSVIESSSSMMIYFILVTFFSIVKRFWKKSFVPRKTENFFVKLTTDAIKMRDGGKNQRDDFINYIMNLRKKKHLSDIYMAAHSVSFFVDGVETSSVALCFTLYYLGKNKRIQEKLRDEIRKNTGDDGKLTFEKITELPYLDQVLNEGLRIVPPAGFMTRVCKNTTTLTDYKDKKLTVEKDTVLLLPFYSVHHDPDIYAKPEEFQPERFDESIGGIKKYKDNCQFLAFGDGPRMCLGFKFAYIQIKAGLAEVVKNFVISVNSKTKEPLSFDPSNILLTNTGGIWLDFKPL